jgi:hypothetical protein
MTGMAHTANEQALEIESLKAEIARLRALLGKPDPLLATAFTGAAYSAYKAQSVVRVCTSGDVAFMLGFDAGSIGK